jgi:replication factor A1
MMRIPYEEIVAKIKTSSSLSEDEIRAKVEAKVKQLSGLVSKEGAAHILANELGIQLIPQTSGKLEIKNVLSGMRDVELVGKVVSVFEPKSFNSNGREGKVASMTIADPTGQMRIVLWNTQADSASKIRQGDIVKLKGGYVKDRDGGKEVHINERSKLIINPDGESVHVELPSRTTPTSVRKSLGELTGTESNVEILATVVQVFEPRFYEVCSNCQRRAKPNESGAVICDTHGQVKAAFSYVLNAYIDDGTDSLRAVFFREQAQKLLGKTNEQLLTFKDSPEKFEDARNEVLGANIKLVGRAAKNEMYDKIEIVAQRVEMNPDPDSEVARMEEKLKEGRE